MASKAKTKAKIGNNGRNIVVTFPIDRIRALLPTLPDGDERLLIETLITQADEARAAVAREDRLRKPLSIESLTPVGWMLTGTHSTLAYGAVRCGDFRLESDGTWAFGPPGAFEREADDVTIMQGAAQGGVMSEEHFVFRLLEPTTDLNAAIRGAIRLETEWRSELPRNRRKPKAMLEGGKYGRLQSGGSRDSWILDMEEADLEGLPEGARISPRREVYMPCDSGWRLKDVVMESAARVSITAFQCDAALRPMSICAGASISFDNRTHEYRWSVATREFDPGYDTRRPKPLTSPYDCVLGKVWAVSHNGRIDGQTAARLTRISLGNGTGSYDRPDNKAFPLATREDADVAVASFAVALGMTEGELVAMPAVIPEPDIDGGGVSMSLAA